MDAVGNFFFDFTRLWVRIFAFIHRVFSGESGTVDLVVAIIVLLFIFVVVYGILLEITILSLTHVPVLSRNPPFYPSSSRFLVRFKDHNIPTDFHWEYPYMVVDGARYNMRHSYLQDGHFRKAWLSSGTEIEFIPR